MYEAIGIDLGGTKIEIGRVTDQGKLLESIRIDTNKEKGPQFIQNELILIIQNLLKNSPSTINGVGIGVAGQIDSDLGIVKFAPNLPNWSDIPLQDNLEKALKLPVKVINDVRAITWGEWLYGAGKSVHDLVCVFVGTGIGAGVVSNGQLLVGHSNTFGEVGHMAIDMNGPICTCGNKGCWESLAGGWGIAKQTQEAVLKNKRDGALLIEMCDGNIEKINAKTVVEAYRLNDPLASKIILSVQQALMVGSVNLINLYNPQTLIIGGGFIDGLPEIITFIEKGIKHRALATATKDLKIVQALLGKQVGVIGAAAVVLNFIKGLQNE